MNGIERSIIQAYNTGNIHLNFMSQAQAALDPYHIKIKSITVKVPHQQEKVKEMEIKTQADFLRALNLIPMGEDLYNPLRGINAYVHQEEFDTGFKSPDSGYGSGANGFF